MDKWITITSKKDWKAKDVAGSSEHGLIIGTNIQKLKLISVVSMSAREKQF